MAEGGNSPRTLEGGSDALFNHECTQCRADGSKQEASHICQDCKQLLCHTCGRYHIRNMRNHTLLDVALLKHSKKSLPSDNQVPVVAKCHYHPDRDIEMYCGTHNMVYCSLCIAKKHRSCSGVSEIVDVDHKIQFSTLISLVDDIANVNEKLHAAKLKRSKDLELIKKKKAGLLQAINAVRKRINKHLDALETKVIAQLESEQKQLEKKINADMNVMDDLIIATDERKPDLTSNYNDKQMFILEKLGRDVLAEASSFIEVANTSEYPSMKFEPNADLCDVIWKSDYIGNIIRSETKQKPVCQHNYTAKLNIDNQGYRSYWNNVYNSNSMCILLDGKLLLTDHNNNRLTRLDEEFEMMDFCTLKARPMGLCTVSHTEVAVRLEDKTIQFISVGKFLSYQRKITLKDLTNANDGLACCTDQLWIPGKEAVYIYSMSGELVKKVETDFHDHEIFPNCSPLQIAVSNDETRVYVAAWDNRVVVFNSDGDVVNELRDERMNGASCVCVTEDDIVLVVCSVSRNILMFDREGNSFGEIVGAESPDYELQLDEEPWSLCYDRQKHRLFVSSKGSSRSFLQLTK